MKATRSSDKPEAETASRKNFKVPKGSAKSRKTGSERASSGRSPNSLARKEVNSEDALETTSRATRKSGREEEELEEEVEEEVEEEEVEARDRSEEERAGATEKERTTWMKSSFVEAVTILETLHRARETPRRCEFRVIQALILPVGGNESKCKIHQASEVNKKTGLKKKLVTRRSAISLKSG